MKIELHWVCSIKGKSNVNVLALQPDSIGLGFAGTVLSLNVLTPNR